MIELPAFSTRGPERRNESTLQERVVVIETNLDVMRQQHESMLEKLDLLLSENNRYKGMIGGIAIVFSGLVVCFELFGGYIREHWK